ncbi:MAG TPA: DUF3267 domain-containing protein [Clostridia bacterium]|jgi:hypothetical protein|nr:DUF3267 domain-containing protein [Clostridia bacterium]
MQNNKINSKENKNTERHPAGAAQFCKKVEYAKKRQINLCYLIVILLFLPVSILSQVLLNELLPNKQFEFFDLPVAILSLVLCVVMHELTHAFAMLLMGVSRSNIKIGHIIKQGIIYCHMKSPIKIGRYRVILCLPFFLTGLLPFIASIIFLNITYSVMFLFSLAMCSGDLVMFIKTMKFSSNELVLDHAKYPAFYILSQDVDEQTFLENELKLENEYKIVHKSSK